MHALHVGAQVTALLDHLVDTRYRRRRARVAFGRKFDERGLLQLNRSRHRFRRLARAVALAARRGGAPLFGGNGGGHVAALSLRGGACLSPRTRGRKLRAAHAVPPPGRLGAFFALARGAPLRRVRFSGPLPWLNAQCPYAGRQAVRSNQARLDRCVATALRNSVWSGSPGSRHEGAVCLLRMSPLKRTLAARAILLHRPRGHHSLAQSVQRVSPGGGAFHYARRRGGLRIQVCRGRTVGL
mmetsp:Transcript_19738/g.50122  ORF Transcript_19738/g.50122 Transcript_19738/m.50122 type:complete len:241 (+) Transcript_19738:721-1443(+)